MELRNGPSKKKICSSGEYWTMIERLIQLDRKSEKVKYHKTLKGEKEKRQKNQRNSDKLTCQQSR